MEKMKERGQFFDTVTVYLKGGNYLKEDNSTLNRKVIYRADSNKIFISTNELNNDITIDANQYNAFGVKSRKPTVEKIDTIKKVNGYKCKLLKLSWGSQSEEYYFYNPKVASVKSNNFKKHNYEYFNTVIKATRSYPLEIIKKMDDFVTAKTSLVSMSKEAVSDELFNIEKLKEQKLLLHQNETTKWKLFKDDNLGYSVEYPESWIPQGHKAAFMCGKKKGFLNAEFTIMWTDADDKERISMLFDFVGEGYEVIEKKVMVSGVEGIHYIRTHKDKPGEYHESVMIKTKSKWYNISNSGTYNKWFDHFYKSFSFKKL